MRQSGFLFAVMFGALCLSAAALKWLPVPLVWICLTWAVALVGGMFCLRRNWARAVFFNLSFLTVIVAAGEAYVSYRESPGPVYSERYRQADDTLGYAPRKGIQAKSSRREGNRLLYDVKYTIEPNGLRVTAPWQKNDLAGTVLFFGCSFTFGEGLNDEATLPAQVGIQSAGRYRTINFGFHGYGPHQMLAAIESGRVASIVDTAPQYAIYTAVPHHAARVAGKVAYGRHAPRYLLTAGGEVQRAGHFDDDDPKGPVFNPAIEQQLNKSAIYRTLTTRDSIVTDADTRLFLAVVRRSKEMLSALYPGIQFHVILWPDYFAREKPIYMKMREGLAGMGVAVHLVEDILPAFDSDRVKYEISKGDGHPNALANQIIAQYVLTKILPAGVATK